MAAALTFIGRLHPLLVHLPIGYYFWLAIVLGGAECASGLCRAETRCGLKFAGGCLVCGFFMRHRMASFAVGRL